MKIGHTIDANGFWTGDVLEGTPDVTTLCPDGFYKPRWDGTQWVEGLTAEEINARKNEPTLPSVEEQLRNLQQAFNELILGG